MKLLKNGNIDILEAENGKLLKDINDNGYTYIDPEGNEIYVPPHKTDKIYLGIQIQTLEQAQELYEEVDE